MGQWEWLPIGSTSPNGWQSPDMRLRPSICGVTWKAPSGSFQEFARKVCEEARGEEHPPVLVGYSMGGRLALHALLEDSEAWSGAMIVSAHPGLQDEGERILRMAADAEWAGKALTAPWVEFLEQWESQSVLQGTCMVSPADRRHLESRREAVARGFYFMVAGETG